MASSEHDVGSIDDFQSGRTYPMPVGGRQLALVRNGDVFYAFRDICPHRGAQLSGGLVSGSPQPCLPGDEIVLGKTGRVLVCPWHGWEFDLDNGQALAESCRGRLKTYPVAVKSDRVIIKFDP